MPPLSLLLLTLACADPAPAPLAPPPATLPAAAPSGGLSLTTTAWAPGGEMPIQTTCEGSDAAPPLAWAGVPAGAASLALLVEDPDAPDPAAPKLTWTHWILYDLPPTMGSLTPGQPPAGARDGKNGWGEPGYRGPCPPIGRHRYFFRLYALDVLLPGLHTPDRDALLQAMQGHILAEASLLGTYQKQGAGR